MSVLTIARAPNEKNEQTLDPIHQDAHAPALQSIFLNCLYQYDTRSLQSLACVNTSFYKNMSFLLYKSMEEITHSIAPSDMHLMKIKTLEQDKRAERLFHILNDFFQQLGTNKNNELKSIGHKGVHLMNSEEYYSFMANDFSFYKIPVMFARMKLNLVTQEIRTYLYKEFAENPIQFSCPQMLSDENPMTTYREFFNCLEKLYDAAGEYAVNQLGCCAICEPNFKPQYQDASSREMQIFDIHPFVCFNYALYQLHEEKAQSIIFENDRFDRISDVFPFLISSCGYELVHEAQNGDLICYLKGDKLVHLGFMQDSQTVLSKWGELRPILSHPIGSLPKEYGDRYFLLRKENTGKPWVFEAEKIKRIRGYGKYMKFNFSGSKSSFSKPITLCGQNFIFWGLQD